MALKPDRVETQLSWTHPRYIPSEAGGLVSFVYMSGMPFSIYASDSSGVQMMGVQRHDVYDFDQPSKQPRPSARTVHDIHEQIRVIVKGDVTTNFIHPDSANNIATGTTAYAGPSGLFTHDSSLGGDIVGMFLSEITADSKDVMVEGDIWKRDEVVHNSDGTHVIMGLGFPRKQVTTPGYAKVRIMFHGSPGNV
jgi:hypothetical protein